MVLKQRQKEEKKEALLSVYALYVYQMAGDRTAVRARMKCSPSTMCARDL
jgi:hypothetical protein